MNKFEIYRLKWMIGDPASPNYANALGVKQGKVLGSNSSKYLLICLVLSAKARKLAVQYIFPPISSRFITICA